MQEMTVREMASLGGQARAKALTPARRRAIARKAGKASKRKRARRTRRPS